MIGLDPLTSPPSMTTSSASAALNVLGEPLDVCGCEPMTGWHRDGFCRTDPTDRGSHTVCCVMTASFLSYSKAQGNDLSTPMPAYGFPGLKPGDHWCVCAPRWQQALLDGMAPPVLRRASDARCLSHVGLEDLKDHAWTEQPR